MTQKRKRQFGVWMDMHHAIIVGRADSDSSEFSVLGMAGTIGEVNPAQKKQYPDEKTLQDRYFKEILFHMRNAEEVHLTGTGNTQKELVNYMAESPFYKETTTVVSASKEMNDDELIEFIHSKFQ